MGSRDVERGIEKPLTEDECIRALHQLMRELNISLHEALKILEGGEMPSPTPDPAAQT
jgi:hypothetical protein